MYRQLPFKGQGSVGPQGAIVGHWAMAYLYTSGDAAPDCSTSEGNASFGVMVKRKGHITELIEAKHRRLGTKGKRFVSKAWDGTDKYSGLEAMCRLDHVSFEGRVVASTDLLVLLFHVRKACLI